MAPLSSIERVPLVFWLGPIKVATARIPVVIENFVPEPGQIINGGTPDLEVIPKRARGILRRSEPMPESVSPTCPQAIVYVVKRHFHPLISLRGSFEGYLATLSGKTRSTLKRKVKKFADAGGGSMDFRTYRTLSEIQEFYSIARQISRETYQEKLFDVGLPANPQYLQEIIGLARTDQVRAYLLFLRGTAISYLFCPASGNRLRYAYLGFRPEYAEHSPGTVLQFLALESLFAEQRFEVFDLGEGGIGQHKRIFATHLVPSANVLYLRDTPSHRLLVQTHRVWTSLALTLDDALARSGFKRPLKRWLRGQTQSVATTKPSAP